jgi:RNA polymerase sigma factor (sigma-70 family)
MDGGRLRTLIRGLRRAVNPTGAGGLTDADLLRRWVAQRDEAAFEALLWRHAAAVLGVCRRVLHDAHEAEDAAQAAFLTLARKARSIGRRQAVAAWLYTVAYRVAVKARARTSRSAAIPGHDLNALPGRPTEDPAWRDLRPVLAEEVSRLPEKYRAAFVLCHVEGRTNEEAARELGCPMGTVLSRLARARQRLRDRLTQRGVTLTAGALAVALATEAATAAVPGVMVRTAVRGAALAAAGKGLAGVVSTEVIALTEGVVRAMLLTKVKVVTAAVVGLVLLGGGGGVLSYRTAAGEPGAGPKDAALAQTGKAAPADAEKLRARLEQKEKEVTELRDRIEALQRKLDVQTARLEEALLEAKERADVARAAEEEARAAESKARERAAKLLAEENAKRAAAGSPFGPPAGTGEANGAQAPPVLGKNNAAQVEQARDEVELLEAQLGVKKAELDAANTNLKTTQQGVELKGVPPSALATQEGQVRIKQAELREAEVRLAQAKRRLAKLQGPVEPAPDQQRKQVDRRAAELEKKLDALKKDLEELRKELKRQ